MRDYRDILSNAFVFLARSVRLRVLNLPEGILELGSR